MLGCSKTSFTTKPWSRGRSRLVVLGVHADVTDLRVGHHHDLTGVRRIGEDLLVAGQAGVEAHLADADGARAEGGAAEDGAVGEHEPRRGRGRAHGATTPRSTSNTSRPATNVSRTRPVSVCPAHGELRLFE